jgi:hypothetical protein
MSDNPNERGPADSSRINVNQDHEVRYWTKALKCTERQLRDAVAAVGVMADDVRARLRSNP